MRNQHGSAHASLRVELDHGLPSLVIWRGREMKVTSAKCIESVKGRWWLDWEHRGVSRRTFRVALSDGHHQRLSADIVKEGSHWQLSKILD